MNKCKRFFFSFILKGFEDSFEVIGVNPSCFGDAFSEKLRKEEREREKKNARCCKSCSAFTTEMVLITSSSRTLTSDYYYVLERAMPFWALQKTLCFQTHLRIHRHHLLARKRQPDCFSLHSKPMQFSPRKNRPLTS